MKYKLLKYYHNDPFVKVIHAIDEQILTKIVLKTFNDGLEIYKMYENIIKEIKLNTILKWIKNNINIL